MTLLITDSLSQAMAWIHNACSFLSVPALIGLAWLANENGWIPIRRTILAGFCFVLFGLGVTARAQFPYAELPLAQQTRSLTTPAFKGIMTSPAYGEEVDAVMGLVRANTTGTEGLLVFPEGPAYYVGARKLCPTRVLNHARTFRQGLADHFQHTDLARLQESPPRYVIFVKETPLWEESKPFTTEWLIRSNRFTRISQWIVQQYDVVRDQGHLTLLEYKR